jgi:hypothetical protein
VRPAPRWGPLPWFVLALTLLLLLLVAVIPPFIFSETPPAWVVGRARAAASRHGDPAPIEAEWIQSTRGEAARMMAGERAGGASPAPSASGDASASASPSASRTPAPVRDPGREVELVVLRGRFGSGPRGSTPASDAPESWLVIAWDPVTHLRWREAVLAAAPELPDDAVDFEL